ncbi:MAG: peptidoglycan-binding domain-containing protein [Planktotalea sp.]|uniref:peptidoglycan-binding domain-containing protein n=1 Tax=Planktotalea sp. TaxID=2029877 RepID=UPI003C77989A
MQHISPDFPRFAVIRRASGVVTLCLLTACAAPYEVVTKAAFEEPDLVYTTSTPPPGAQEGSCWGKHVTPAEVETVTHQIQLQPAEIRTDGTLSAPAVYKTETSQMIVKERRELWFETPCAPELTPEFVSSLQRALKARGQYRGAVTGYIDPRTRAAIRKYQAEQGLDSSILSLAAARKLGLIAYGDLDNG